MQMQMANRLLCNLTRRTDQIHPSRSQGALNCVSNHERRGRQLPCGVLVGIPQIRDVNPRDDQRVAWGGRVEWEEGDPRWPFTDHLRRWVGTQGNSAKRAVVGRSDLIADRFHKILLYQP
jgi:hypothetical protein